MGISFINERGVIGVGMRHKDGSFSGIGFQNNPDLTSGPDIDFPSDRSDLLGSLPENNYQPRDGDSADVGNAFNGPVAPSHTPIEVNNSVGLTPDGVEMLGNLKEMDDFFNGKGDVLVKSRQGTLATLEHAHEGAAEKDLPTYQIDEAWLGRIPGKPNNEPSANPLLANSVPETPVKVHDKVQITKYGATVLGDSDSVKEFFAKGTAVVKELAKLSGTDGGDLATLVRYDKGGKVIPTDKPFQINTSILGKIEPHFNHDGLLSS